MTGGRAELLSQLVITVQGHKCLEKTGVMTKLGTMLQNAPNTPFSDILLPGLVKFWGNVAHLSPGHVLNTYPEIIPTLINMISSQDTTHQTVALETVGYIGVSLEGKTALNSLGNVMLDCVDKIGDIIRDSVTELKITALNTLSSLLKLDPDHQTRDMLLLTETWFNHINNMEQMMVSMVKTPFLDLRLAVYQLMLVVSGQGWGRRVVLGQPGLCEYLLDRSNERDAGARHERWRLMKSLVESRMTKEMLGPELDTLIREFVNLGPHHVQVESQVAYEEQQ